MVAELTLALILFHDAAQVPPRQIEADRGLVLRLLLVGLPLTVPIGFLAARMVFPAMPVMMALLLAAASAPTDACLGAATVLNPVVPVRIRRALNVESGLNDGLITTVVLFAIAAAAGEEGLNAGVSAVQGLFELGVGDAMGAAVGAGGGLLLGWSRRRDLSTPDTRSLGVPVLPILAYCLVAVVGGNSFVAAFVAGTAFTVNRAAQQHVDDIVAARQDGGAVTISVEALAGQPGQVLCAAAGDADLLVVGRSGHGSVTESLLGSVGLHCVMHALSPVTVVRAGSVDA